MLFLIAAAAALVGCAFLIVYAVHAPYQRRPHQCEVCGKHFTDRQAVIVTEEYPADLPDVVGGTTMTATFCRRDRP